MADDIVIIYVDVTRGTKAEDIADIGVGELDGRRVDDTHEVIPPVQVSGE